MELITEQSNNRTIEQPNNRTNSPGYLRYFLFVIWLFFILYFVYPPFGGWGGLAFSQTPGEWTWMHGDNTPNSPGVFGTQSVPNPANNPPALYEPCEWKDNNGNFWLF